ncbi:hypothetical protein A11A3_16975 [Alcanivorax hongdengensis A-11-3]|uniref:Transmembrane protein n=1 Tax=Alcanivorax hongdengensis A-11-3 TaxID=1177179 RepID=L0W775_9GAMM|nr:hypothetical protein [Alcanivorax hongdengensis]EKF72784.1 hypothetical protein A11A3_16975 [Alcanivorax hongdengensis A-11-3]
MKRFYYLMPSLPIVKGITEELRIAGINENRLCVLGQNPATVVQAHVHAATTWEETDVLHSGFLGALIGTGFGLLLGLVIAAVSLLGNRLDSEVLIATSVFGTCFGAWLGGIRGLSSRNHHLQPYLQRVDEGDYLMMVDADDDQQAEQISRIMARHSRDAEAVGQEDFFRPFE